MERNKVFERLNEIFRDNFDDPSIEVVETTVADDIPAWDSLEHINLVNEIEEAFEMQFTMKEVTGMKNVGEMVDIILERTPL